MAHLASPTKTSGVGLVVQRLGAALQGRPAREQRAVLLALWVVGLALLWWVFLGPAIGTLRQSGQRHAQLDKELSQMQSLAASAEVLRTQNATPAPPRELAVQALQQATLGLGPGAQMSLQDDRASLTLRDVNPAALAQWLHQVRINARLFPVQAQLQRSGDPSRWSGQIVVAGPGLGTAN